MVGKMIPAIARQTDCDLTPIEGEDPLRARPSAKEKESPPARQRKEERVKRQTRKNLRALSANIVYRKE